MELLISIAMMVSIPTRFSWLIFVPICGRASITMSRAKAACRIQNFTEGRKRDTSGISAFSKEGSPNLRSRFFWLRKDMNLMSAKTGISTNR